MAKKENLPLQQAWNNWVECLKGEDTNSVFQQISTMIWDTSIFRLILEGRQIQIEKAPENPTINGSLHSFVDRNYFTSQSTYIRRLTDDRYGLTGKRGVYSVSALVKDISDYRNELTRETFFRLRSMPYDYAEIQEKEREFLKAQVVGKAFFIPSEYDWERIAETHQIFDRLSGCSYENRQLQDIISEKVFIRLQEKLAECKKIKDYVDKFVAHSATPESRFHQNVNASEITLKHLWNAHQIIFEVAEFLSVILLSEDHMALAIENPSFFQNWDTPIFEEPESNHLQDAFKKYREETKIWNVNGIENIWRFIEE
jgi:hypothetical protein